MSKRLPSIMMSERQRRWLLSGGIGSGKSEVRRLLDAAGIATLDADSVGHAVLEPGGPAFSDVLKHWPAVVVDGRIDRSALAVIVFGDPSQLAQLESFTHPHIFGRIKTDVEGIDGPVVVEIPLLESGLEDGWRRMVVDCDDDHRLARILARGMSHDDAIARMNSQPDRGEWLAVADLVVPNQGSLRDLAESVSRVAELL